MDRLLRDYKQEEGDPCSKLLETETLKRLEAMKAIIQSYDEDRESIVHGFGEVKYTADKYISMILSNVEVRLIQHAHSGPCFRVPSRGALSKYILLFVASGC